MLDYHRMLLGDEARTLAFREALRRVVQANDVVVDLGSGSGVLAFLAIEAGARKVYAIERSHMADVIALLAKRFGVTDRVEVLHEQSEKIEVAERGHVLVTETLGAFGLQEQILSLTIDARSRLLVPHATIIPKQISLVAVPIELSAEHDRHVHWWTEPRYGFDFSPLAMFAANQIFTAAIAPANFLAEPEETIRIDLGSIADATVTGNASFTASRDGLLHGFGGWFSATLADDITITNAPGSSMHWQQMFLPVEKPLHVTSGMQVPLELQSHDGTAWRWRGRAGDTEFDQTTWLMSPPCIRRAH